MKSVFCRIRSSRPEVFCKKGVLRNLAKVTGKHLYRSLFFSKVAGVSPASLLKRDSGIGVSREFCGISKNTFFHRTPPVATSVAF